VAAAGNPNITDQLLKGVRLGDRTYKNHLDGYDQTDLLTGRGPSKRHEVFYFGGASLGALRLDDFKFTFYTQPYGWPGEKTTTDMPGLVNIRQDPFERTPMIRGVAGAFPDTNDALPGVLALRPGAAIRRESGEDRNRVSADAGPGFVQP
jgi:arylsulfatase